MTRLRDYQEQAVSLVFSRLENKEDSLIVLPTGSGKTVIFVDIIQKLKSKKILVLTNRIKLVKQTIEKLSIFASDTLCDISVFCGTLKSWDSSNRVVISVIDSIKNHAFYCDIVIVDEYHNFERRPSYERFISKLEVINPDLRKIMFTATPYSKGRELRPTIVYRKTLKEMINENHLCNYKLIDSDNAFDTRGVSIISGDFSQKDIISRIKDDKILGQCVDALKRALGRKKIAWACLTIDHCKKVVFALQSLGESAVLVHSKLSTIEHEHNMFSFENGDVRNVVFVTQLSEGYDYPPIDCIVCFTPTRSANKYVQILGRGLRNYPGKKDCLFLDYGGVVVALGDPSSPRLIRTGSDLKKKTQVRSIICPQCREVHTYTVKAPMKCDCGYDFSLPREIDPVKNLYDTAFDGKIEEGVYQVLGVTVNHDYVSKKGDPMIQIIYRTLNGPKFQYIFKNPPAWQKNFYWEFMRERHLISKTKKVKMDSSGKFVVKRFYD